MALDYTVHTYIATGGSEPRRKSHYIHSIKFYDNEEEIPAEKEDQEYEEARAPEPRDLLHLGNLDGYILEDAQQARITYNE